MRAGIAKSIVIVLVVVEAVAFGEPAPPVAPLAAKTIAARCDEPCLFLVDTAIDGVADAYRATCKAEPPSLLLRDCGQLDLLRKCVYAAHGFAFKQPKWKAYAQRAWFVAHPEFKPSQLTPLERANVRELDARTKACKRGVTVSAADEARAKAWVAALSSHAPAWPSIVLVDRAPATGAAALKFLRSELKSQGATALRLDKSTVVYYDDADSLAQFADAVAAPPDAKLRAIVIDRGQVNTVAELTEGVQVRLFYDEHDVLLAIDVSHYLWD